ncbi:MAG TPA: hypothetical protein VNM22_17945 [Candidatus Limnocylindrales bacterium]|nr:hypothetical protein [Candidatus Limnocylindrales bacterium]
MRNLKRLKTEIELCEKIYGKDHVLWSYDYSWVQINRVKLPPGFNQKWTNLLIIIPDFYQYGVGLEEAYISPGLKMNREGKWVDIPHYFDSQYSHFNRYVDKGWCWICVHPVWHSDDNILTFIEMLLIQLAELQQGKRQ